jgi:hypothetical protein
MNVTLYRIYPLESHIHWFQGVVPGQTRLGRHGRPDAGPAAAPVRGGPRVLPERVFQR